MTYRRNKKKLITKIVGLPQTRHFFVWPNLVLCLLCFSPQKSFLVLMREIQHGNSFLRWTRRPEQAGKINGTKRRRRNSLSELFDVCSAFYKGSVTPKENSTRMLYDWTCIYLWFCITYSMNFLAFIVKVILLTNCMSTFVLHLSVEYVLNFI